MSAINNNKQSALPCQRKRRRQWQNAVAIHPLEIKSLPDFLIWYWIPEKEDRIEEAVGSTLLYQRGFKRKTEPKPQQTMP